MPNGANPPLRVALVVVHGVGDQAPGDTAKAARVLSWRPRKALKEIVAEMVDADLTLQAKSQL